MDLTPVLRNDAPSADSAAVAPSPRPGPRLHVIAASPNSRQRPERPTHLRVQPLDRRLSERAPRLRPVPVDLPVPRGVEAELPARGTPKPHENQGHAAAASRVNTSGLFDDLDLLTSSDGGDVAPMVERALRDEPEKFVRTRRAIALLADAVLLTLASPLLAIWAIGAGCKRLVRGKQN